MTEVHRKSLSNIKRFFQDLTSSNIEALQWKLTYSLDLNIGFQLSPYSKKQVRCFVGGSHKLFKVTTKMVT